MLEPVAALAVMGVEQRAIVAAAAFRRSAVAVSAIDPYNNSGFRHGDDFVSHLAIDSTKSGLDIAYAANVR
jgi:hypothetical protein